MAPEQLGNPRRADACSDISSLGCTFYYLLTGREYELFALSPGFFS